ncbi:MAG TPA: glucose 1-dehydrogenase [Rubrivivax sp.]|nr:glucose 1-dehydrogenase [Rubrivivax sp.]
MRLEGKRVVVTGAASGIGLATAATMARAGAAVVLADLSAEKGNAEAHRLRSEGLDAAFEPLDVASPDSVSGFAQRVLGAGEVHVLVNGAGWGRAQAFMDNEPEFWERIVDINLMGPIRLARAFLRPMVERNSGKIVNVASDAGRVGSSGETVYSGAKGGLISFTKSLAREMARCSINVNCVCPGPTETPMLMAVPERHREAFLRAIPLRRFGKPSDVADAILFFASGRSDYITGQVLSVSGGLTMV